MRNAEAGRRFAFSPPLRFLEKDAARSATGGLVSLPGLLGLMEFPGQFKAFFGHIYRNDLVDDRRGGDGALEDPGTVRGLAGQHVDCHSGEDQ